MIEINDRLFVNNKKLVIDRLDQLKIESGHSDKTFKDTLASITGKTSRTIRRWYSLESGVHDNDIELIAHYFGKHVHWLRYGDRTSAETPVDQIMASNHFGVVILKDNKVEEVNFKFSEMMKLSPAEAAQQDICDKILQLQSPSTVQKCNHSNNVAYHNGAHTDELVMLLGDKKEHRIEATTLNLSNGRILKILFDKGLLSPAAGKLTPAIDTNALHNTNSNALKILFVDDDIANCQLYSKMLSIHNCQISSFINSSHALNEFKQNPERYDLLISDIIMPEMTGDKLAAECRHIKPGLPVILYTGYQDHLSKTTAEEYGVAYCLQKPINSNDLLAILNSLR